MSETKLKPCPFCGGEVTAYADKYNKVMISCDKCKMYFGIELEIGCELEDGWKATYNSKEEAIEKWNTRKPMDNIVAELEEEKDYSYADMDEYASRYELNLADCDDWFYKGLARAIDIVKAGGAE